MMSVLTASLMLVLVSAVFLVVGARRHDQCPSCKIDFDVVAHAGDDANATYDVLACPQCTNAVTRVADSSSHLAVCPRCGHRAMETTAHRYADGSRVVNVEEHCHLCGHEAVYGIGEHERPLGKVLAFPGPEERRRA